MERQSLIRYIIIALSFVLVFVGISYLVYRFSARGSQTSLPSPSPTLTSLTSTTVTSFNPTVLPPPLTEPIDPRPYFYSPAPIVRTIQPTKTSLPVIVAYDGKGNLLFNNLTHEENFGLQRLQLQGLNERALTRTQGDINLSLQRETNRGRRDELNSQIESLTKQLASQKELQNQALYYQTQQQIVQLQLERDQLLADFTLQEDQLSQLPTANDQYRLAALQADSTRRLTKLQYKNQSQSNQAQLDNQIRLIAAQSEATLQQLSLEQKQEIVNALLTEARQRGDQQYALEAMSLAADIEQAKEAAKHQQNLELTQLQATINERLVLLAQANQSYGNYGYSSPFAW